MDRSQVITFVARQSRPRPQSLHKFISAKINPLLKNGWKVSDVRIKASEQEQDDRCALEVFLIESKSQQVSSIL